jgi:hypothetical protein
MIVRQEIRGVVHIGQVACVVVPPLGIHMESTATYIDPSKNWNRFDFYGTVIGVNLEIKSNGYDCEVTLE